VILNQGPEPAQGASHKFQFDLAQLEFSR
jgi:hypothetical protein